MSGELSSDSMFVGAWNDMLGGKKSGNGRNESPIEKNVTRDDTPVLAEVPRNNNESDIKQVPALLTSGRRRTRGSAIVLSSQKMQKFLRSNSNDSNSPNRGSDLISATNEILDARKAQLRRGKAVVAIQKAWRFYRLDRVREQEMLKYLQGGKWTKSQADRVFSLFLGWRIRFLMRSMPTQKSLRALNDVYAVISEIISTPSTLSPPVGNSQPTCDPERTKGLCNLDRQIMLDTISESNGNQFRSEVGRSLGILVSSKGMSRSDRSYADRVLVDRLIKEALQKRKIVYGILFDGATWCLLPNLKNSNEIDHNSNGVSNSLTNNDNNNDNDNSENTIMNQRGSENNTPPRKKTTKSSKKNDLGNGYWDFSTAIKSVFSTYDTHINVGVDCSVSTNLGSTVHSPVNHGNSSSSLGPSNVSSPAREAYPTQHFTHDTTQHSTQTQDTTQHFTHQLNRQRSDTFHTEADQYLQPSKNRETNISTPPFHRNYIKEDKEKENSMSKNNSIDKFENNLLHRKPSFSLNFDTILPEKDEKKEMEMKNIKILSRKGSEKGNTDNNENVIQSHLISLRAQVQHAMKKKSFSESMIMINNSEETDVDISGITIGENKGGTHNQGIKENTIISKDENKIEKSLCKSKGIMFRKVQTKSFKAISSSSSSSSFSSSVSSSDAVSVSVRPDGLKASIQLDILQADRLMLAKKVRLSYFHGLLSALFIKSGT